MHLNEVRHWQHPHTFGTDEVHAGERTTRWVMALTFRDAREQMKSMVAERPGGFVAQILGRELGL